MSKQDITISVEVEQPYRWQPTGELRKAGDDEPYFNGGYIYRGPTTCDVLIARKVEPKRESRWVAVMDTDELCCIHLHSSKQHCVETLRPARIPAAVIRLDIEDGKIVSVALEPVEESHG